MINAANQSLVFEGHDISSCRFCAADGECYPFPKTAKSLLPRWLLPAYGLRNHIQASVLLAIIRCLSPVSHVVHFAILHLPSTVLQHPDVIAPVKDAESLVDVIKSILDPVRPGDTDRAMISTKSQGQPNQKLGLGDILGVHPRLLRSDHVEHQKVGDKVRGPRSIAGTFDGSYSLLEAIGLATVGSKVGTVVNDVFGHHLTEGGVVLTVDKPCCLVSCLGEGFDCGGCVCRVRVGYDAADQCKDADG